MIKHSRFIAFLLATVFFLSVPGPVGVVGVQAAEDLNFALEYEKTLAESIPNSSAPRYSTDPGDLTETGDGTPKIMAKWDFLLSGTYYLRYHIDDGQQILLRVTKEDEKAQVSYRVLSTTKAALVTSSNYTVYSRAANGTYVDYSQVNFGTDWTAAKSLDGTAVFDLTQDKGFSFRYNSKKMHFYWNVSGRLDDTTGYPEQNKFYFVTNGVREGKVYDFELYYTKDIMNADSGGDVDWAKLGSPPIADPAAEANDVIPITDKAEALSGRKKIMTGFTNMTSKPIANAEPDDPHHGVEGADELYRPADAVHPEDEWPASDTVKLKMSFDLPKEWDPETSTFKVLEASPGTPVTPFPDVTMRLNNNQSDMRIHFSNITEIGGNRSATISSDDSAVTVDLVDPAVSGDKVVFYLNHLRAGQIFTASMYLSSDPKDLILKDTYLGFGKVFTHMPYLIRSVDDQFYVFVTPYAGYSGYYLLKINGNVAAMVKSDGTDTVKLSANSVLGQQDRYQVFFSTAEFSNVGEVPSSAPLLNSQILYYIPTLEDTTVSNPNNFRVVDYDLRFGKTSTELADLDLTLEWDIAKERTLKNLLTAPNPSPLTIEYDINHTLTPGTDSSGSTFTTVTVEIEQNGSQFDAKFTSSDGKLVSGRLIPYRDITSNQIVYRAQVDLTVKAANANVSQSSSTDFMFPRVYFLSVKPVLVNGKEEGVLNESLYDSITLDEYEAPTMPAAQNLESKGTIIANQNPDLRDEVSILMRWTTPLENLKKYLVYLFEGSGQDPDDDTLSYNLYISKNEKLIEDFTAEEERTQRVSKDGDYISAGNDRGEDVLYVSQINGIEDEKVLKTKIDGKDMREALRGGNIVGILNIPVNEQGYDMTGIMSSSLVSGSSLTISYTLDGLDKNQKYYMVVETAVKSPDAGTTFHYSLLSSILAETTKGDPEIMDPSEADPPAPVFQNPAEVNDVTAVLTWDRVKSNLSVDPISTDYQIIRTKNGPLSESDLNNTSAPFREIWDSAGLDFPVSDLLGFQTNGQELELYENNGFVALTDEELYRLDIDGDPPTLRLWDKTLGTNSIYYYYIRTVRVVKNAKGQEITRYSKWNGISVTSEPVKVPKNLKIEQDMNFDRYTETIISFDAPIAKDSVLGRDYDLEYQLKVDDGSWETPVVMEPSLLTVSASAMEGYQHYVYKITGLSPNTLYNIRVRVHDLINKDYSAYSNAESTKTDFKQEDYDDQHRQDDWTNYLTEMLQKLLKDPYWITRDSSSLFEAVYRPTMFDALLAQGTGGLLQLVETDASKAVYYLPASAVLAANNGNVGFKIVGEDMDLIFSSKAVNPDYNDAVFTIAEKIKEQAVSDYFVRITVTWTNTGGAVEGDLPLTKQADVQVEAVGSRENITKWDKNILTKLALRITDTVAKSSVGEEIQAAIKNNDTGEEMVKLIAEIVDGVKRDFIKEISSELSGITRYSYAVDQLDASLILTAKGLDPAASVKAYQLVSGSYLSHEVTAFGDNKAIYTSTPGVYIFTGRVIVVPGLDQLQGAGSLSGIIGKYGLDDFFGKDIFDLEAFATRSQVIGSIARMAGAPKGAEPFAWLSQNKGVTLSTRDSNGSIQSQEAVYLVMALYEIRTGTKIATIQIRNYSLTANMAGLSDNYKQSVRAAFELGICTNSDFVPRMDIRVKGILEMLSALDAKNRL